MESKKSENFQVGTANVKRATLEAIGLFYARWAIFERNSCQNYCQEDMLSKLAKLFVNEKIEITKLDEMFKFGEKFRHAICEYLEKEGPLDENVIQNRMHSKGIHSNQMHNPKIELVDFFLQRKQDKLAYLTGLLYAINRIRNNFLHGLTDEDHFDEKIDIYIYGSEILALLSRSIFHKYDFDTIKTSPEL